MSLSLSLSLPNSSPAIINAVLPNTRTRRYYALKNTDGTSPVLNPFYNPYGNDELDFGQAVVTGYQASANPSVLDTGVKHLADERQDVRIYAPDGQSSVNVYWGSGNTDTFNAAKSLFQFPLSGNERVRFSQIGSGIPSTPLTQTQITAITNAELTVIISGLPIMLFNPSTNGWSVTASGNRDTGSIFSIEQYTAAMSSDLLTIGETYNIFLGGQSFLRPENQIPSEFSRTIPTDTNNRGIVEVDVHFTRNHENSAGFGPTADRTTDTDTYYITGMSLIRDHGPSGDSGAYGSEYGNEYN